MRLLSYASRHSDVRLTRTYRHSYVASSSMTRNDASMMRRRLSCRLYKPAADKPSRSLSPRSGLGNKRRLLSRRLATRHQFRYNWRGRHVKFKNRLACASDLDGSNPDSATGTFGLLATRIFDYSTGRRSDQLRTVKTQRNICSCDPHRTRSSC